jgi:hypothetical protein
MCWRIAMMQNRQSYERATLAVVALNVKDVITTSGVSVDGDTSIVLPEDIF